MAQITLLQNRFVHDMLQPRRAAASKRMQRIVQMGGAGNTTSGAKHTEMSEKELVDHVDRLTQQRETGMRVPISFNNKPRPKREPFHSKEDRFHRRKFESHNHRKPVLSSALGAHKPQMPNRLYDVNKAHPALRNLGTNSNFLTRTTASKRVLSLMKGKEVAGGITMTSHNTLQVNPTPEEDRKRYKIASIAFDADGPFQKEQMMRTLL